MPLPSRGHERAIHNQQREEYMKYRYYIVDLINGCVKGTNNEKTARDLSECEEWYVIDAETGKWIVGYEDMEIHEVK
jgi:hypothetical protein